jgi:hypothetical protein
MYLGENGLYTVEIRRRVDIVDPDQAIRLEFLTIHLYGSNDAPITYLVLATAHPLLGRFYFDSMARDCGVTGTCTVHDINIPPNSRSNDATASPIVLNGVIHVNGYVPISHVGSLLLFRIEDKNIDLIVSIFGLNDPVSEDDKADFNTLVTSLRIMDFGVFRRRL